MPIVDFVDAECSSDDEPIFQNSTNTINNDKRPRSGSKTPSPNPPKKVRHSLSPIDRNRDVIFWGDFDKHNDTRKMIITSIIDVGRFHLKWVHAVH